MFAERTLHVLNFPNTSLIIKNHKNLGVLGEIVFLLFVSPLQLKSIPLKKITFSPLNDRQSHMTYYFSCIPHKKSALLLRLLKELGTILLVTEDVDDGCRRIFEGLSDIIRLVTCAQFVTTHLNALTERIKDWLIEFQLRYGVSNLYLHLLPYVVCTLYQVAQVVF